MRILPHFYRRITAKKEVYSRSIMVTELFVFFLLVGIFISFYLKNSQLKQKRTEELQSLSSWEHLISKFSNYPDAYYEAAVHAARLKDNQRAMEYLDRALLLNPSFVEARTLQDTLGKL